MPPPPNNFSPKIRAAAIPKILLLAYTEMPRRRDQPAVIFQPPETSREDRGPGCAVETRGAPGVAAARHSPAARAVGFAAHESGAASVKTAGLGDGRTEPAETPSLWNTSR